MEAEKMKTIALIAHDGKKADRVAFVTYNREKLKDYHLINVPLATNVATADLVISGQAI
jgi:methylglyoxal synthase